jgi:hypothetical protein
MLGPTVVPMEVARRPPRARSKPAPAAQRAPRVSASAKEIRAQRWSAAGLGAVAAVITGLSLSHLSHGIEVITHPSYAWEPWAMAVGIDLGMVAAEVASLVAGERVRQSTRWWSASLIIGTLVLSACMNAFGFASQAPTLPFQVAGVVFGVAVPAAIWSLMRLAATHWLDSHRRS